MMEMNEKSALPVPPPFEALRSNGSVAVFLDFDGTLVDLALTPDGIDVPPDLATRLEAFGQKLEGRLALVSGRATDNLEQHLGPLALARAGSHGIARFRADGSRLGKEPEGLPPAVYEALQTFADSQGFDLEIKTHGAALHYRGVPHQERDGLTFAENIAKQHALHVKRGKFVIELVRPGANKGGAVQAFMEEEPFRGAMPIFIGDDVTDEDGFNAVSRLGGFGILVGDRFPTEARYMLASPKEVFKWLGL
ncbi:trehalose-phosphatase [Altericroceibacterium spongiae]|uniref:Trehalose 6-phosphate phosphatase n=1 Tax=Altericroceibacterium spongiae TaxID=2320269 RepID=A0A420EEZ9_9SPHN|nr:trehalose-phosphatase [Altericroceibacterium spongiae]RKF19176.1 trehalose-phosphatase [Altericroceibacterium spongiae]